MPEVISLHIDQLKTHPRNMRRFYPDAQVREMAASIKSTGGVIQPLVVTPNGNPDHYLVVDGNLRLAAARLLGDACPELFCRVTHASEAEQLLTMVATTVRYDVDPISEALHYRALLAEHYSIEQISAATGKAAVTINNRLRLLDLDDDIQQLVASGKLIKDFRIVAALNSIPDRDMRVKMAQRFADDGATFRNINTVCERMLERIGAARKQSRRLGRPAPERANEPMLAAAEHRASLQSPAGTEKTGWRQVRAAARAMCDACEAKEAQLHNAVAEPAWEMITHAATDTCKACTVREVAGVCIQCPGVDLLQRLIKDIRHTEANHVH